MKDPRKLAHRAGNRFAHVPIQVACWERYISEERSSLIVKDGSMNFERTLY